MYGCACLGCMLVHLVSVGNMVISILRYTIHIKNDTCLKCIKLIQYNGCIIWYDTYYQYESTHLFRENDYVVEVYIKILNFRGACGI